MKISPFQALTILAKKYQNAEAESVEAIKFNQIKSLFLMGVKDADGLELLKNLLQDEALSAHQVALVEPEEFEILRADKADLDDLQQQQYQHALAKLEIINNDPTRRHFESMLCHDTVKNSIDGLDAAKLEKHFDKVFSELSFFKRLGVKHYIYESDDVENKLSRFSSTAPEYVTATSKLKDPKNLSSFRPEQGDGVSAEQADKHLQQRMDKMMLIIKTAHAAMSTVHTSKDDAYPLNIYGAEGSPFAPERRGRANRVDQLSNEVQTVKSSNLGIMRSYQMAGDDALFEPTTMKMANQYRRPADASTYIAKADMPQEIFKSQVSPFVNSISGTMLCQLRVIAKLLQEGKFEYANDPEQFKLFMKNYVAYMIYNAGGHSLMEFTKVWTLPQVQQMFAQIPGIGDSLQDINLQTLFQDQNEVSFDSAMAKAIRYNDKILAKDALHQELSKRGKDAELPELEAQDDELSLRVRAQLKSASAARPTRSVKERIDAALEQLLSQNDSAELDQVAASFLISQINAYKRLNKESADSMLDNDRDSQGVIDAFARLAGSVVLPQGEISQQQADVNQSVIEFFEHTVNQKEAKYYEASTAYASFASRVDLAWDDYNAEATSALDKKIAREFLVYALDLPESQNLNDEVLVATMALRLQGRAINPDYIPGRSPLAIAENMAILAEQVDQQYAVFQDQAADEQLRLKAQDFLIFALNIKNPHQKLTSKINAAMGLRVALTEVDPHFVPGRSPLPDDAIDPSVLVQLKRTQKFQQEDNPTIKALFERKELLDVITKAKLKDNGGKKGKNKKTIFFNPLERDSFRIDIRNGLFMRNGEVTDTKNSTSHDKKGFAAFTLDANGELSVFPHINHDQTGIAHSSMNDGKPVVCAGEVKIENGVLKAITTYSGHYRPSLYNIYKALEYFEKRGVDVSKTKLLSFENPGAVFDVDVNKSKKYPRFYESKAQDLLLEYKASLRKNLHSVKAELQSYDSSRSGLWYKLFHKNELTDKKREIANALIEYLDAQEDALDKLNQLDDYQRIVNNISDLTEHAQITNKSLAAEYNRSEGGLAQKLSFFQEANQKSLARIEAGKKDDITTDLSHDHGALKSLGRAQG